MESQESNKSSPPSPSPSAPPPALRFAILRHQREAEVHWDLLLELPGQERLLTWQIPVPPEYWLAAPFSAPRLPDHRRVYLTFEGPLTENRGHVTQADAGTLTLETCSPDLIAATLRGRGLPLALTARPAVPPEWTLAFTPADPA